MIEDGVYQARPVKAQLGFTKGNNEQVAVEFELADDGRHITWYGYFTERTTDRTIESLRFCGWTGQELDDLREIGTKAVMVELVIEAEEYNGVTRAKVQWVNRGGGLQLSRPLDAGQARSFAQRMKGAVMAFDMMKAGGQPPAPQAGPAPAAARVPEKPPF